jgi:hypothetical protein
LDYVDQRRTPKRLAPEPSIHETAHVARSELGAWTAIGAGSRLLEVAFGDYSYCVDLWTIPCGFWPSMAHERRLYAFFTFV